MTSTRFHILLKALWILLKLTLRIVIKVLVWGIVIDIARRALLSIDAVVYYIGDFTQAQRELISHRNILGLILIIYTCKLLIQIVIWIKYTARSLINKSDNPIRDRFIKKHNKSTNLIRRRFSAFFLDSLINLLILFIPIVIKFFVEVKYSLIRADAGLTQIRDHIGLIHIISFAVQGIYFVYFDQSKKGSPGKRVCGLKVIDESGRQLSTKVSLIRFLYFSCMLLPSSITDLFSPSIGLDLFSLAWAAFWLMPVFFTKEKVTLYDILSKTRVVSTSR